MIARVIGFEWYRWRRRRGAWLVASFVPLATVLYALLVRALAESGVAGAGLVSREAGAPGYQLAFRTAGAIFRLLGAFAIAWGAFAVAPELDSGTHRMPLLRVGRGSWVAGKCGFLGALAAALFALAMTVSLVMGAASYRLGGVSAGGYLIHSSAALFTSALAATALAMLPLATLVLLGVAVSTVTRSGELALLLSFAAVALLWGLSLLPGAGGAIFLSRAGWPLAVAASRSEGLRSEAFAPGLASFVLVHFAWIAALGAVAVGAFRNRDLP